VIHLCLAKSNPVIMRLSPLPSPFRFPSLGFRKAGSSNASCCSLRRFERPCHLSVLGSLSFQRFSFCSACLTWPLICRAVSQSSKETGLPFPSSQYFLSFCQPPPSPSSHEPSPPLSPRYFYWATSLPGVLFKETNPPFLALPRAKEFPSPSLSFLLVRRKMCSPPSPLSLTQQSVLNS